MKTSIVFRLLVLSVLINHTGYSQQGKVDSLKALIPAKYGTEKIDLLYELAYEYIDLDNNEAIRYGKQSLNSATGIGDSLRMVKAGRVISSALRRSNQLDSAVRIAEFAERIAFRNNYEEEREILLNSLGAALLLAAKYDKSLYYHLKSLALREMHGDKQKISIALNNIGVVYFKLKNYKLALEYFNKCFKLSTAIQYTLYLDRLLINISLCHAYLGNLKEARNILEKAMEKCPSKCSDDISTEALFASGIIWLKSDSLNQAELSFFQSYTIAKNNNNYRFVFDNIICLSKIFLRKKNFASMEEFLNEGYGMAKSSDLQLEKIKIYEEFCSLYSTTGNYERASFFQEKYIQLKDSIFNAEQTNNLMRLHAEAAEKENKIRIASQAQLLNVKNDIIKKQRSINLLIGLAILVLALLIYFLTRIFHDRKTTNILLNKKVLERTAELKKNNDDLALAMEQLNAAIAKLSNDLHVSIESIRTVCSTRLKSETDSNAMRYFDEIDSTTVRLSNSINSILAESKIAS